MSLLKPLTDRRILRYVVAYGAAGWAILEGVDTLADNGILPEWSYVAMFSLFLCGVPGALIVSWFHGAKGRQHAPAVERWLLVGVAVFAIVTTGFVVRGAEGGAAMAPAAFSAHEDPARVAVLYFDPRGDEDAELLALGLTETLIDELSAVGALTVVSRNGSQMFRGSTASPDSIGRALAAGTLVSGTVTQSGERLRVDVALIRAATGEQYAQTRLESPRAEIFALQDALADTVSSFLRRQIGTELGERNLRAGTRSVEAWQLLQAAEVETRTAAALIQSDALDDAMTALVRADSLLARAEAADPAWPEPTVRRGWVAYRQARLTGLDRDHYEEWIRIGQAHAVRALARDPRHASALELRATLTYWSVLIGLVDHDAADEVEHAAESDFRAAIAAGNSPSARNSLSHLLLNKGEVAEARLNALRAYENDPFLENVNLTLWRIFTASWSLQDDVEARRSCGEGARRFPNDFRFRQCELMLFALPGSTPDIPRVWALLDDFTRMSPPQARALNHQRGRAFVALALLRANRPDSARSVLRATTADASIDPLGEVALTASIGYTWLGELDDAVRELGVHFAVSPGAADVYRSQFESGSLPWYHKPLMADDGFRSLIGAH